MKFVDFKIGADPELHAYLNKDLVYADAYVRSGGRAKFSADGSGRQFELRPAPEYCPFKLTQNIFEILKKGLNRPDFLEFNWKAGATFSNVSCCGGHIHFELPREHKTRTALISVKNVLASFLAVPISMIDKNNELVTRLDLGYGYIYDFRYPRHGIECRAPSSWLVSPHITAACLCLGKTVMFEYLNNNQECLNKRQKHIGFEAQELRKSNFNNLWEDIQKFKLYSLYKQHLDLFPFLINNNLSWYPKCSIREAWGIPKPENIAVKTKTAVPLPSFILSDVFTGFQ
jgi:hypothetical protein